MSENESPEELQELRRAQVGTGGFCTSLFLGRDPAAAFVCWVCDRDTGSPSAMAAVIAPPPAAIFRLHRITDSQKGLGWMGPHSSSHPAPSTAQAQLCSATAQAPASDTPLKLKLEIALMIRSKKELV